MIVNLKLHIKTKDICKIQKITINSKSHIKIAGSQIDIPHVIERIKEFLKYTSCIYLQYIEPQ